MVHHGYPVAERLGLLHVVRGEQDGLALVVQQPEDVPEVHPGLRVEPGGRLVEEQHLGPVHQRPGDQQPPGLPAGQVGGDRLAPVAKPERVDQLRRPPPGLPGPQAEEPAAELQVLRDRELHVEGVVLGDHADPALDADRVGHHVDAGHPGPAPGGHHERGQHADRGGLARPVGAEQAEQFAGGHIQVDAADGGHVTAGGLVRLAQILGADRRPGGRYRVRRRGCLRDVLRHLPRSSRTSLPKCSIVSTRNFRMTGSSAGSTKPNASCHLGATCAIDSGSQII